jgi:UDP-N-acetyl-D-mannosaminuronate dehydrogenase
LAQSIKVAEAAKVIENTQRDVNIALMNEFTLIFNRIGIDTEMFYKLQKQMEFFTISSRVSWWALH